MLSHYRTLPPLARNNSSGRQPLPWDYVRVVNPEVIQKQACGRTMDDLLEADFSGRQQSLP
jgi:hypothetical protein